MKPGVSGSPGGLKVLHQAGLFDVKRGLNRIRSSKCRQHVGCLAGCGLVVLRENDSASLTTVLVHVEHA